MRAFTKELAMVNSFCTLHLTVFLHCGPNVKSKVNQSMQSHHRLGVNIFYLYLTLVKRNCRISQKPLNMFISLHYKRQSQSLAKEICSICIIKTFRKLRRWCIFLSCCSNKLLTRFMKPIYRFSTK